MNQRIIVACCTLVLPFLVSAQYFIVDTIRGLDIYDQVSLFPDVIPPVSKSAWPEDASTAINTYLKFKMLSQVQGNESENVFETVFPNEEHFGGQSEFDFDVSANNREFISLLVSYSFTGAYTEYANEYFSFSSKHGEHLTLQDFFEGENYDAVGKMVSTECAMYIHEYLAELDMNEEYAEGKKEMYEECLLSFPEVGFPSTHFYLTDSTIVFTRYRCSNHMMAALDDLWEFHVPKSFEELRPYLSEKGRSLLLKEVVSQRRDALPPEDKILRGTLDGKYPIIALFSSLEGPYLSGVYWYEKYKTPIDLYSGSKKDGVYEFWEKKGDQKIARLEFVYDNGQIIGTWEKADGTGSLPLVLSVH